MQAFSNRSRLRSGLLRIGQVASAAGVSRYTVRYYERLKLLRPISRTRTGYRLYSESHIEQLRMIKRAQRLGLSLDEIRRLHTELEGGLAECHRVRDLLRSKIEELNARLAEMQTFRRHLVDCIEKCEEALANEGGCCPVLSELSLDAEKTCGAASVVDYRVEEMV